MLSIFYCIWIPWKVAIYGIDGNSPLACKVACQEVQCLTLVGPERVCVSPWGMRGREGELLGGKQSGPPLNHTTCPAPNPLSSSVKWACLASWEWRIRRALRKMRRVTRVKQARLPDTHQRGEDAWRYRKHNTIFSKWTQHYHIHCLQVHVCTEFKDKDLEGDSQMSGMNFSREEGGTRLGWQWMKGYLGLKFFFQQRKHTHVLIVQLHFLKKKKSHI